MNISSALRIARAAPHIAELLRAAEEAANAHDPALLAQAAQRHGYDLADALVPGLGAAAGSVVTSVQRTAEVLRQRHPDWIEGEARVVAPWDGFAQRLFATPAWGHVILGPMGRGKTTIAKRLAWRYAERYGYQIECLKFYPEDLPPQAVSISEETLIRRMAALDTYLDSFAVRDDEEEGGQEDEPELRIPLPPPAGRVILIDEAILSMRYGKRVRTAAMQYLVEARHLRSPVIYVAHMAKHLASEALSQTVLWVKEPEGKEPYTDRDNREVRELWLAAIDAFANLHRHPCYEPPFLDRRSWAYCRCLSIDGKPGYDGLIAFEPAAPPPPPNWEEVA